MSDILEILKQHKILSLRRSESFTAAKERHVADKASHVKCILGGEDPNSSIPIAVVSIRDRYYNMLKSYRGESVTFPKEMNKRSVALWTRVENARAQADCDAERYLKAQFSWFDKAFGRAPTLEQLATETAIDRALEFTGSTKGRVLGNIRKAPISKADVFRESEKTLQRMMAAQECTREEFYRKFILTGAFSLPKEFLGADPTYQRVIKEWQTPGSQ
jgi:hypothetical protein